MIKKDQEIIVAIDLGGRTAKVALAKMDGSIIHRFIVETKKGNETIPFLKQGILSECKSHDIDFEKQVKAIGFGCVGPLNIEKGISINAGKIDWYNYPVREVSEREFQKPVYLINDARSIAVGEWKKGAGKNYHTFIIFSIGTGIGGGIILNNKIYRGAHNLANEFGHGGNISPHHYCLCGLKGCVESSSSATGIENYFQDYIKKYPLSSLGRRQETLGRRIEIKDVADLVKAKDPAAIEALSQALYPLAQVISMQIFAFDPQAVLIGGGPSMLGKPLLDILNHHLRKLVWHDFLARVDLKLCALKNDAGMIGVIEFTLGKMKGTIL